MKKKLFIAIENIAERSGSTVLIQCFFNVYYFQSAILRPAWSDPFVALVPIVFGLNQAAAGQLEVTFTSRAQMSNDVFDDADWLINKGRIIGKEQSLSAL